MNPTSIASHLDFAVDLAMRAGEIAHRRFRTDLAVDRKADRTPVTAADREAEQFLRHEVEARFPEDGIIGEEYGVTRPGAHRQWLFDPIDGTHSFVRGVPLFGTMVAFVENQEPILGVIHLPALGETVWAARGKGCYWNGAATRVSAVDTLAEALVLTTDAQPMTRGSRTGFWDRVRQRAGICRTWGDCYGYVLLATGRAEVMIDSVLNVWDAAAVIPIVEEAGGAVTDLDGLRRYDGGHLIATNAALNAELQALLREDG